MYIEPKEKESYQEYIQRILTTRKNCKINGDYMERHHIIPKSSGGTNELENLIYLYPQEHYWSHKLLAEENLDNLALQRAWWILSHRDNVFVSVEEYAKAKQAFSQSISGKNHPQYGKTGELSANYGKHLSEETKLKIAETKKGEKNPQYGKVGELSPSYGRFLSTETKEKISQTKKSQYIKEKHPMYNKKHTEESKKKMSDAKKGKKIDNIEQLEKMSERMRGENNPMHGIRLIGEDNPFYGKHHSENTKKKISNSKKGKNMGQYNITSIKVRCVETNVLYNSMGEAQRETGILSQNISKCCNGVRKTAGGFHWLKEG